MEEEVKNTKSKKTKKKATDTKKVTSKTKTTKSKNETKKLSAPAKKNINKKPKIKKADIEENSSKKDQVNILEKIVFKENKKEKINYFKNAEVIFLILITCVVSICMGWTVCYKLKFNSEVVIKDSQLEQFIETYNRINDDYYNELDKKKLIKGAISGMLSETGDLYSTVIDDISQSNFDARLQGKFVGIGVEVTQNENNDIVVVNIFNNSPAFDQDIRKGDIIATINGVNLRGQGTAALVNYIGTNDIEYKISIIRDKTEIYKSLKKRTIIIDSVSSKVYEKNNKKIGYIKLDIFSGMSTEQFRNHLSILESKGINSLIIDVRDNDGGYLETASNIVSMFLSNKHVIYCIDKKGDTTKYYSKGSVTKKYPIIVLQNEGSASASEILSVALKEEYKATVVGERSYGKGTVQELVTLSNGIEYKYTSRKWLSPNGKWINSVGIIPDVRVQQSNEYYINPTEENDTQLQKALSLLAD